MYSNDYGKNYDKDNDYSTNFIDRLEKERPYESWTQIKKAIINIKSIIKEKKSPYAGDGLSNIDLEEMYAILITVESLLESYEWRISKTIRTLQENQKQFANKPGYWEYFDDVNKIEPASNAVLRPVKF